MAENTEALFSTAQVAEMYGVDISTVRRWCRKGQIEATRLGHDWVVPSKALTGFVPPQAAGVHH
jgi:excisionase family DNA binding protein